MIQKSKMEAPNSADVSFATNGDQGVCSRNKLNVSITSMSPRILMLYFDNYQGVIANENKDYRALLGYQIHYRKIDRWTYEAKNLTKYEGRDACGGDDWVVIDHMPSGTTIEDGKQAWPREGVFVTPLDPYTHYAFFVTTMLMREFGGKDLKMLYACSPCSYYILTSSRFRFRGPSPWRRIGYSVPSDRRRLPRSAAIDRGREDQLLKSQHILATAEVTQRHHRPL